MAVEAEVVHFRIVEYYFFVEHVAVHCWAFAGCTVHYLGVVAEAEVVKEGQCLFSKGEQLSMVVGCSLVSGVE